MTKGGVVMIEHSSQSSRCSLTSSRSQSEEDYEKSKEKYFS